MTTKRFEMVEGGSAKFWEVEVEGSAVTVRYGGKPWIVIVDVDTGKKRRLVQGEAASWSPLPDQSGGGF